MDAKWTTRVSLAVCLLAAAVTAGLACLTATGLSVADVPILLFVVGPYLVLGGLAWWQRTQAVLRIALLVVIAVLGLAGLCLFGVDTWHYFADPRYRQIQRMTVFLIP